MYNKLYIYRLEYKAKKSGKIKLIYIKVYN